MTKPQSEGLTAVRCSIWLGRGRLASGATREYLVLICGNCDVRDPTPNLPDCEAANPHNLPDGPPRPNVKSSATAGLSHNHNRRRRPPFPAASG